MPIERAIKLLEEEYEHAKGIDWIRNPVAWALHKVWEIADSAQQPRITTNTAKALERMGRAAHRAEGSNG